MRRSQGLDWTAVVDPVYGVATISRLLEIIRLFGEYRSLLKGSFAKETYNVKEPTNRSHPIATLDNIKTAHRIIESMLERVYISTLVSIYVNVAVRCSFVFIYVHVVVWVVPSRKFSRTWTWV